MQKLSRLPILSARLEAVASLVKSCGRVFDIGTDHAFLPIELIRRGICRSATASDIRPGPITVARRNIARAGLSERIETVVTAGLAGHEVGPQDAVVLSGLGGLEMIDILSVLPKPCSQVILQPQKSAMELRLWLDANRYRIEREDLVLDRDRIYVIIRAVPDEPGPARSLQRPAMTLTEAVLGPDLLQRKPPLFDAYLQHVARHVQSASRRLPELAEVMAVIQEWLHSTAETERKEGGEP
ncbi:MAG: SAM-dependent methyltransferase [Clostridia bacterium]|nr:SAM-dependent methyltransferase [Clostridia bacterium]